MGAVDTFAPIVGIVAACASPGVLRASYYRSKQPAQPKAPGPRPSRAKVLETLDSERFANKAQGQVRERRHQLRQPSYAKPELVATGPNQVRSRDITKPPGAAKRTYFYLYVVLDIFRRYVVGWTVATRRSAARAALHGDLRLRQGTAHRARLSLR